MLQRPITEAEVQALMETIRRWLGQQDAITRARKAYGGGFSQPDVQPQQQAQAPQAPSMPAQMPAQMPAVSVGAAQPINDFRGYAGLQPVSTDFYGLGSGIDPARMTAAQQQLAAPVQQYAAPAPAASPYTGPPRGWMADMGGGMSGSGFGSLNGVPFISMFGHRIMLGPRNQGQAAASGGRINSINTALRLARGGWV